MLAQRRRFESGLNCRGEGWPALQWQDNEQNVFWVSCVVIAWELYSLSAEHGPRMQQVTMTPRSLGNVGIINRSVSPKMNHFSCIGYFNSSAPRINPTYACIKSLNCLCSGARVRLNRPKRMRAKSASSWTELFKAPCYVVVRNYRGVTDLQCLEVRY